jgi:hypothetical protein
MKKSRLAIALASIAVVAAVTGCTASTDQSEETGPEYLWTVTSVDGMLSGPDDDNLYLALDDVSRVVTRFTDRPDRLANSVDIEDFLGRWDGRFADDPPNAVLSYQADGGAPRQIVLTLTRPRWDEDRQTLVFAAERIRAEAEDPDGEHAIDVPDIENPWHTGPTALFIDGAGTSDDPGPVEAVSSDILETSAAVNAADQQPSAEDTAAAEQAQAQAAEAQAQIDELTQKVSYDEMLRTDLLAARGDVADGLGAGRQPVSSTVRFLAEQGIDISEPVSDGDLRAVDALIRQVTAQQEADMAALTDAMSAGGGGGPEDQALIAELQESLPDATG